MQVRKPFTQYSRVYTGTGKQIARYWVAWKFTAGFRTSRHSSKFRTARAHFVHVVFSVFWYVRTQYPTAILSASSPVRKELKRLSVSTSAATASLASYHER